MLSLEECVTRLSRMHDEKRAKAVAALSQREQQYNGTKVNWAYEHEKDADALRAALSAVHVANIAMSKIGDMGTKLWQLVKRPA